MNLVDVVTYTILLVIYGVAAYMDVKSRMISDKVWILTIVPAILTITSVVSSGDIKVVQYIVSIVVGLTIAALCYVFNITGGADVKAIALLSISCPPKTVSTDRIIMMIMNIPAVAIICNTIIPVIGYTIYILAKNIKNFHKCKETSELRGIRKILYVVSTMCIPVREVLEKPHKYAITCIRYEDKVILRPITRVIYDDPVEELRKYMSLGILKEDDNVLVLYYIPYVTCIFIGLVLYLLFGNVLLGMYRLFKSPLC